MKFKFILNLVVDETESRCDRMSQIEQNMSSAIFLSEVKTFYKSLLQLSGVNTRKNISRIQFLLQSEEA